MSFELPRFNQRYVSAIAPGSAEAKFVASVGEVSYLGRANSTSLSEVDFEVRRPILLNLFDTPSERDQYMDSFSERCEQKLVTLGLEELVLALNGLKVAADELKGRNILWTTSDFRNRDEDARNDEYILGSKVGFYPNIPTYPAMYLELSENTYDEQGVLTPVAEMWDVQIPKK